MSQENINKAKRPSGSKGKQHKYYIDISDIEKMLVGSTRLLERASLDRFTANA